MADVSFEYCTKRKHCDRYNGRPGTCNKNRKIPVKI